MPVEVETACRDVRRHRREARHVADHLPGVQRPRRVSETQGLFALSQPCPRCRGNGTVIEKPCPKCRGTGRERRRRRYTVKIPAGVKDGTRSASRARARPGSERRSRRRSLRRRRASRPRTAYERRGDDLIVEVPVTFADAALGAKVEVPTPEGPVSLKVPAGSERRQAAARSRAAARRSLKGGGKGDVLARAEARGARRSVSRRSASCSRSCGRSSTADGRSRPRYMISVAAELVGMHPQTLRIYERRGSSGRSARPAARASTPRPTSSGCA